LAFRDLLDENYQLKVILGATRDFRSFVNAA
jgi:hypothetical protein